MGKVNVMFNPNAAKFATINDPKIVEMSKVIDEDNTPGHYVLQQDASSGLCFVFPISDFQICSEKSVKSFDAFVRRIAKGGNSFCLELPDDITNNPLLAGRGDAQVWFIGHDDTNATIGLTWDKVAI